MALFNTNIGGGAIDLTGLELVPNSVGVTSITANVGDYLILSLRYQSDVITGADLIGTIGGRVETLAGGVIYLALYKATSTTVTTANANGFAGVNKITVS